MRPGNYCTYAIEHLTAQIKYLIKNSQATNETIEDYSKIISALKCSIKFTLPNCGKFYDFVSDEPEFMDSVMDSSIIKKYYGDKKITAHAMTDYERTSWGPPYAITAFEYYMPPFDNPRKSYGSEVHKKILLVIDTDETTLIIGVWYLQERNMWTPATGGILVPKPLKVKNGCLALTAVPLFRDLQSDKDGKFDLENILHNDYADELSVLVNVFCFMRCNNVYVKGLPAPKMINKSRKKKGKTPFFEYKVLEVKESVGSVKVSDGLGRKHKSPRIHLRRGHIRSFRDGTSTYVSPCVVGSKKHGMVHKGYSLATH